MSLRFWGSALSLAFVMSTPVLASDMSLDEVLAKNMEARGGADTLKSKKSARLSGRMTMGPMEAPFVMEYKRPGMMRLEFTIQGMTAIQAYDGKSGWQIMPFTGKLDAEPLGEEELKQVKDQADFDGPLVDWKAKGHQVALLGQEEIEGTQAWKLSVTKADGTVDTLFLDAEYFLEIAGARKVTMRGQEMNFKSTIGDYKEVDGLMLPHSFSQSAEGMPGAQTFTIDKVEFNVDLPESRFTMPAPTPKTEPAPAGD